jgi:hypothetical protein
MNSNSTPQAEFILGKLQPMPYSRKNKSAIEFSIKIVPSATDVSFSSALITGAMAAMALPPQMAVPLEIKCEILRFIPNHLPKK